MEPAPRRLDFYQDSKNGRVLRAMTLSDMSFWGADVFIGVILVLYVINFIDGGSATHAGLAFFLYRGIAALAAIPVGRFYDRHRGYIDEVWGLTIASLVTGSVYMLLSFSSELWQLYAAMFFLGLINPVNILSWNKLFNNHINMEEYSETLGTYRAILSIFQGVAVALGGLMGDAFGFNVVVFCGGVIIALGGFFPFSIKYLFEKNLLPAVKKTG